MLSLKIGLPQYKNSPPKVQKPAYFQKVVDTKTTQQLRRKVCLRSEKRAAFYATSHIIQALHFTS